MLVIALTSDLIRKGRVLGALDYGEVLGVDMYKIGQKRVSVFYSGMLSGAHAVALPCFTKMRIGHLSFFYNNNNSMSPKSYKIISIISVTISLLLVIGGCFAPWIFTGEGCERLDFTETGQIGDTIGGLMGPFIAMAGVFLTFVAFLMQVKANEIQREQLHKSFNMKQLEHMIECLHALQLLHIDIQNVIKDIELRCDSIENYCRELDDNPLAEVACKRTSSQSIKRYQGIDRNLLYKAVNDFVQTDNKQVWYRNIYAVLDLYSEGVDQLWNDVYIPNTKDIMHIKSGIPELYTKLVEGISFVSDSHNKLIINRFKAQAVKLCRQDGSLDISALNKLLDNGAYNSLYADVSETYQTLQNALTQMMNIGINMSKEMSAAVNAFRGDSVLGELTKFEETLSQTLLTNTDVILIDKFENNDLRVK